MQDENKTKEQLISELVELRQRITELEAETERKRVEKALAETTQLLETILDHTHMLVAYLDPQFNFVRVNRAYAEADEREPSFFPGKNHFDLYPNAENEGIFRRVVETGEPYFAYAKPFEYAEHPERGVTYWDWSLVPIKDPGGAVTGLVFTLTNVTERVRAEEALRESEARYRALVEQSLVGVYLVSKEGFIYQNKVGANMFGYRPDEIVGRIRPIDLVHPDDRALVTENIQKRLRGKVEALRYTFRGLRKDGTTIECEVFGQQILHQGQPAILGTCVDITERKRAEEALRNSEEWHRLLLNSITDGCWVLDAEWRYTLVNEAGARLVGMLPDQLVGRKLTALFPGIEKTEFFTAYERSMKERITESIIGPFIFPDGRKRFYEVRVYPAPDGILCIGRDITERMQAEEQLQRYAAELEQSNEELKTFAYTVSHDLRTPLVNIRGFSDELDHAFKEMDSTLNACLPLMDEKERAKITTLLQDDVPEALEFIGSSISRMDHLLNAILKLSRLGRRELEPEPINMKDLVQSTLESLAHQLEQRSVRVTVGALPEVVADRVSIEQIMGNILDNAVKYLEPERPGEIEITAECSPEETTFHVRDNGRGIAKEDVPKIFDLFRRVGKQDVSGEGMGLAYARTLIRRHGGRVWCESEPGVGTTFSFTIPRRQS